MFIFLPEWTKINNVIDYAATNGLLDLIQWACTCAVQEKVLK
jgi:hypothetical protein